MVSFTTRLDRAVKTAYTNLFRPTVRSLGAEYRLKKAYSSVMSSVVDSVVVEADGLSGEFELSTREYMILRLADLGGERPVLTDFLNEIRPGDLVYDVGAFVGMYSVFAAKAGADVVAFEPNPENRERLARNLARNDVSGVDIQPVALGEASERVRLLTGSLLDHRGRIAAGDEGTPVRCLRGDAFVDGSGRGAPDVLKIDVEGAEHEVLAGFGSTLSACDVVFCEVHTSAVDPDEITDLLRRHGFDTEVIHERTNELFVKGS